MIEFIKMCAMVKYYETVFSTAGLKVIKLQNKGEIISLAHMLLLIVLYNEAKKFYRKMWLPFLDRIKPGVKLSVEDQ